MDKMANVALALQMIEAAEKNIQSARQLLREFGGSPSVVRPHANILDRSAALSVSDNGKVIEGVFDGQNMVGPDGKVFPVPANYASKSKLVVGDVLKLTIAEDGSFIYKQIGPIERRKLVGLLIQDDKGDYRVMADGKPYRVLLASLTYYKAQLGDEVTIVVPENEDVEWAAVEHVIQHIGAVEEDGITAAAPVHDDLSFGAQPYTETTGVVDEFAPHAQEDFS